MTKNLSAILRKKNLTTVIARPPVHTLAQPDTVRIEKSARVATYKRGILETRRRVLWTNQAVVNTVGKNMTHGGIYQSAMSGRRLLNFLLFRQEIVCCVVRLRIL